MHKFDEMYAQLPVSGLFQAQSQTMGGMSQSQVQGVRNHYQDYAQWLGRQPGEAMRARR